MAADRVDPGVSIFETSDQPPPEELPYLSDELTWRAGSEASLEFGHLRRLVVAIGMAL
jgi:hypothetical protein